VGWVPGTRDHDPPGPRLDEATRSYHRALAFLDRGDEVAARRAIEVGLARAWRPHCAPVRDCLDDLGAQLDAEAALRRFAARTPGPAGWLARPDDLARRVMALGRAHLVEAVVEEIGLLLSPAVLQSLMAALARTGTPHCVDLLIACAAVLGGRSARAARHAVAGAAAQSAAARALAHPRLAAAWCGPGTPTADQGQVVLAVARDGGRVAPLVALIDRRHGAPVLRDAFFLPDMVPGRLEREVLGPMRAAGLCPAPARPREALHAICHGLRCTLAQGGEIPSEAHQSVVGRVWRLHAACGGSCTDPCRGNSPDVG